MFSKIKLREKFNNKNVTNMFSCIQNDVQTQKHKNIQGDPFENIKLQSFPVRAEVSKK